MRKATNIARENLISLGTCIGKFTKSRKFKLHITALDVMAPYAKVKSQPGKTIAWLRAKGMTQHRMFNPGHYMAPKPR